jgi:DNA-binding NtrC family response regulator
MDSQKKRILVVEDDQYVLESLGLLLTQEGYEVGTASEGQTALQHIRNGAFDLVIADLKMPKMDGLELLKKLRAIAPEIMVIIMTAYGSIKSAVEAMKLGASDYITKPISADEIRLVLQKVLEKQSLIMEIKALRQELEGRYGLDKIIGKDQKMQEVYDLILTVARTDATVLITGETGTGKELVARAIHYNSARKNRPFVAVNCSAMPETLMESELFGYEAGAFTGASKRRLGKFEFACGGSIFLDETASIPLPIQTKLLRVLQEKEFERIGGNETVKADIRLITATNKDLKKEVEEGHFREDLFYRLNVFPIHLPPLRERRGDIPLLVSHFLEKFNKTTKKEVKGVSQEVLNGMMTYHWPGNVRELENLIERAVIIAQKDVIGQIDLPKGRSFDAHPREIKIEFGSDLVTGLGLSEFVATCEKEYLTSLLKRHEGHIGLSASEAKIDTKTLYRKLKEYQIKKVEFKRPKRSKKSPSLIPPH